MQLPYLNTLLLNSNKIRTLPYQWKLIRIINKLTFDVTSNPLLCTCKLKYYGDWISKKLGIKYCQSSLGWINSTTNQSRLSYLNDCILPKVVVISSDKDFNILPHNNQSSINFLRLILNSRQLKYSREVNEREKLQIKCQLLSKDTRNTVVKIGLGKNITNKNYGLNGKNF